MDESKAWYASKGVWGGVLAVASVVGGYFGVKLDEATQTVIVDQITGAASAIGIIVGAVTAIYGRIAATKQIGG
jgi:uncharacterized membrane protein